MNHITEYLDGTLFQDEEGNQYKIEVDQDGESYNLYLYLSRVTRPTAIFVGTLEESPMGWTLVKHEKEKDRYRKLNAWTIPLVLTKLVDSFQYVTDKRQYVLEAHDIPGNFTQIVRHNGEDKMAVPVRYWNVQSLNERDQKRLDTFGVSWTDALEPFLDSPEGQKLAQKLSDAYKNEMIHGEKVYPARQDVFRLFRLLAPEDVKVLLLGQRPYRSEQASGVAFGLKDANLLPATEQLLEQVEREYKTVPLYPSLVQWVDQGVFLWNVYGSIGEKQDHEWDEWAMFTGVVYDILKAQNPELVCFTFGEEEDSDYLPPEQWVDEDTRPEFFFRHINADLLAAGHQPIQW